MEKLYCPHCGEQEMVDGVCLACGSVHRPLKKSRRTIHAIWALVVVILIGVATTLLILGRVDSQVTKSSRAFAEGGKKVYSDVKEGVNLLFTALTNNTLLVQFRNENLKVSSSSKYQVAELDQVVTFAGSKTTVMGTAEVDISVPVIFTYTVDFNDHWAIHYDTTQNPILIEVIAPQIRWNEPAANISEMQRRKIKTALFNNGDKALEDVEKQMRNKLIVTARDNIPLIREIARKQVETFFSGWLWSAYSQENQKKYRVEVRFSDEVSQDEELQLTPPTKEN